MISSLFEMFLQKTDKETAWIDPRVCHGRARGIG